MKLAKIISRAASLDGVSTVERKPITTVRSIAYLCAPLSARTRALMIFRWLISWLVTKSGRLISFKTMLHVFVDSL